MFSLLLPFLSLAALAFAGTFQTTLELTWKNGSPDGFEREMIHINDQFPGPLLEIHEGDNVEITVVNKLPFNTTIHYHGIDQQGTPWADGVPGITQRPIQPGDSYIYKWSATQYGSYFYHAHSRGQMDDGCYGAIIIKPKKGCDNPFEKICSSEVRELEAAASKVQPIIFSDWRHTISSRAMELQIESGIESQVCMDSLLVNGKGHVECWSREDIQTFTPPAFAPLLSQLGLNMTDKGCIPPGLFAAIQAPAPANISALPAEVFDVCTPTEGTFEATCIQAPAKSKWLALDLISTAGIASMAVSIDEHPFWVYAADGHYIEPVKVDALPLLNGDRYSVFVELNKPAGQYALRVASTSAAQLLSTAAVLTYGGKHGHATCDVATLSSTPSINQVGALVKTDAIFFDPTKISAFPPEYPQPAPEADQTLTMTLQTVGKSYQWSLNGTLFDHAIDDLTPPLLYQDPSTINSTNKYTIVTKNDTWVDLIMKVESFPQPPHPIHKHSNKAFIIGQGEGFFNWTTVAQAATAIPQNFNFVNPPFRDTFVTPPATAGPTWLVVRYHVENPGAFLLHCHIQSHLEGGMGMVILDGVDEWPEVPDEVKN